MQQLLGGSCFTITPSVCDTYRLSASLACPHATWAALSCFAWRPTAAPLAAAPSRACTRYISAPSFSFSSMRLQGTWAALSGFAWQPAAAPLVTALGERVRERTLGVLTGAYNTISGPRAASFLGLSEADAIICERLQVFKVAVYACGWCACSARMCVGNHSSFCLVPAFSSAALVQALVLRISLLLLRIDLCSCFCAQWCSKQGGSTTQLPAC